MTSSLAGFRSLSLRLRKAVNRLFSDPQPRKAKRNSNRAQLFLEPLEDRTLMAASLMASLNGDGLLRVEGTKAADTITVRQDNDRISVAGIKIQYHGEELTSKVKASLVRRIEVYGLGGNDTIRLDRGAQAINVASSLDGGAGNDNIVGGAGNDTLQGGTGADRITLDSRYDRLTGYENVDQLTLQDAANIIKYAASSNGKLYTLRTDGWLNVDGSQQWADTRDFALDGNGTLYRLGTSDLLQKRVSSGWVDLATNVATFTTDPNGNLTITYAPTDGHNDHNCNCNCDKAQRGNNGVGNGIDPQPPGNPPVNDGPGTSPGNPGNRGGASQSETTNGSAPTIPSGHHDDNCNCNCHDGNQQPGNNGVDTVNPTATVTTPVGTINSSGASGTTATFVVTYADTGSGINPASFKTTNLTVDHGATVTGVFNVGNVVTYTIKAGGATWGASFQGTYTIGLVANQVKDNAGNAVAASASFSTFSVDTVNPTATVTTPVGTINSSGASGTTATFVVTYADTGSGINPTSFKITNLTVDHGATVTAVFNVGNVVTYTIKAGGATWGVSFQGTYTIGLVANQVKDNAGNAVAASASFSTFNVNILQPSLTDLLFSKTWQGSEEASEHFLQMLKGSDPLVLHLGGTTGRQREAAAARCWDMIEEMDIDLNTRRRNIPLTHVQVRFEQLLQMLTGASLPRWQSSSPLILDLNGSGFETTTPENGHMFDLTGSGQKVRAATVAGDTGVLVFDRDGSGQVRGGKDLFGDQNGAPDGFTELARHDADRSGAIDAHDPIFRQLNVWQDRNRDGVASADELRSLAALQIARIQLEARPANEITSGNRVLLVSSFVRNDGTVGKIGDVWFNYLEAVDSYTTPVGASKVVASRSTGESGPALVAWDTARGDAPLDQHGGTALSAHAIDLVFSSPDFRLPRSDASSSSDNTRGSGPENLLDAGTGDAKAAAYTGAKHGNESSHDGSWHTSHRNLSDRFDCHIDGMEKWWQFWIG